jgi:hypothetical protein
VKRTAHQLSIKAMGEQWARDEAADVIFDTTITDLGGAFRVDVAVTNTGSDSHALALQEWPATYLSGALDHEVGYFGASPFTGAPMDTVDYRGNACPYVRPTEQWVGFARADGVGVVLAAPTQAGLTADWSLCRFDWASPTVSYAAPIASFAMPRGSTRTATYFLIPGPVSEARSRVYDLLPHTSWDFDLGTTEGWAQPSGRPPVADGSLLADLRPEDSLISPMGLGINGSQRTSVVLDAAHLSGATLVCVRYRTLGTGDWSAAQQSCQTVDAATATSYIFDFSGDPWWRDHTVDQLAVAVDDPGSFAVGAIHVANSTPAWSFGGAAGVNGWSALHDIQALAPHGAALTIVPRGRNPALVSPSFSAATDGLTGIRVRLWAAHAGTARLYLDTDRRPIDTAAASIPFAVSSGWGTYEMRPDETDWAGNLVGLRLDLPANGTTKLMAVQLMHDVSTATPAARDPGDIPFE